MFGTRSESPSVQVSTKGLRELVSLQHLARLSLKCCTNVNDQALKAVGQITSLTCVVCAGFATVQSALLSLLPSCLRICIMKHCPLHHDCCI